MRAVTLMLAAAAALSPSLPTPLPAQPPTGAVTGIVTDSANVPIAGAEVFTRPAARRTLTDSAGRFTITGLDAGAYMISVRKLGFASKTSDFELAKNGGVMQLDFSLARYALDTVRVSATGTCPGLRLAGFSCRRTYGTGIFLDFPDIDERGRFYAADLFRDLPGFRVQMKRSTGGLMPAVVAAPGRCLNEYVDGMPVSISNRRPERSVDLAALEVYQHPDSIPLADARVLWRARAPASYRRCQVVLYWSAWNARDSRAPRPIRSTDDR